MKDAGCSDYRGTVQMCSPPTSVLSPQCSQVAASKELHYKFRASCKVSVKFSGLKNHSLTYLGWKSQRRAVVAQVPHFSVSCGEVRLHQGRARCTALQYNFLQGVTVNTDGTPSRSPQTCFTILALPFYSFGVLLPLTAST